ncbi:hypothetical protein AV530_016917 [Patagioenas fasciata monilis]|uniref:Uncharacterized protein n=1 Tax=Patagioenas fasciata monilis TaxID=372326 RepID=A0A1V4J599_PATFA|nr:hypothetical protein AV530_016917 [Patagioenas fasciata monilis]
MTLPTESAASAWEDNHFGPLHSRVPQRDSTPVQNIIVDDWIFAYERLDLFANRRKKKIQEREGFGAAPRSRISDVF